MKPLVAGDEGSDGRLSPPATQLYGTLRLCWVTAKQKVMVGDDGKMVIKFAYKHLKY